jgi:hypothetical protein
VVFGGEFIEPDSICYTGLLKMGNETVVRII